MTPSVTMTTCCSVHQIVITTTKTDHAPKFALVPGGMMLAISATRTARMSRMVQTLVIVGVLSGVLGVEVITL